MPGNVKIYMLSVPTDSPLKILPPGVRPTIRMEGNHIAFSPTSEAARGPRHGQEEGMETGTGRRAGALPPPSRADLPGGRRPERDRAQPPGQPAGNAPGPDQLGDRPVGRRLARRPSRRYGARTARCRPRLRPGWVGAGAGGPGGPRGGMSFSMPGMSGRPGFPGGSGSAAMSGRPGFPGGSGPPRRPGPQHLGSRGRVAGRHDPAQG